MTSVVVIDCTANWLHGGNISVEVTIGGGGDVKEVGLLCCMVVWSVNFRVVM